ncbi:MAG: hypothetical protein JWR16_972 [Nevskia sp.]|nr:hypothetical protein [Nevskia sp.]
MNTSQDSGSANDDVARGLALDGTVADPELTRQQVGFLQRQAALQTEQLQNLRTQNLRDRLRIVFDVALSLGVVGLLSLAAWGVIGAWRSQNVVVSAFEVPPSFEQQGLSGTVVAAAVLDRLRALQDATRTTSAKRDIEDAWSGDLKLEIPEAHVSIGELQRYLHDALGNETRISGSLIQQSDVIALTVRGRGIPAKIFSGKREQFASLTNQAAEYLYGRSEPTLFAAYLVAEGRDDEAIALAKASYTRSLAVDRPALLNSWANGLDDQGQVAEALEKHREAIRLKPDFWVGYSNVINDQFLLGDEEGAYRSGRDLELRSHRHGLFGSKSPSVYYLNLDTLILDLPAEHQDLLQDEAANHGEGSSAAQDAPADAEMLARMHDTAHARLVLQTSPGLGSDPYVAAETHYVEGLMALDRGDYAAALTSYESLSGALEKNPGLVVNLNFPYCWIALGEELGGHARQADAALQKGGHLVDCYRFKGDIDDHRGDWVLAQQDYAAAVALAPDLPGPYDSWGAALARHGDAAGAIAKFKESNRRGPHWCDPLERWGEVLASQGDLQAALERYAEAAKYTPAWGHLDLVWAQALEKLGRKDKARQKYRAALDAELSDAERKLAGDALAQL